MQVYPEVRNKNKLQACFKSDCLSPTLLQYCSFTELQAYQVPEFGVLDLCQVSKINDSRQDAEKFPSKKIVFGLPPLGLDWMGSRRQ